MGKGFAGVEGATQTAAVQTGFRVQHSASVQVAATQGAMGKGRMGVVPAVQTAVVHAAFKVQHSATVQSKDLHGMFVNASAV